jgi:hypothetical protein
MPFFYANELGDGKESKRGVSARKERVRTSPSTFFTLVTFYSLSAIDALYRAFFHVYLALMLNAQTDPVFVDHTRVRSIAIVDKFSNAIPLVIPNVMVPFANNVFSDRAREIMGKLRSVTIMPNTGQETIYLVDSPTLEDLKTISDLQDEWPEHDTVRQYIHIAQFEAYHTLISRLSLIARGVHNYSIEPYKNFVVGQSTIFHKMESVQAHPLQINDDPDLEYISGDMTIEISDQEFKYGYVSGSLSVKMGLLPRNRLDEKVWGKLADAPTVPPRQTGILAPYERNYAQPDPMAFFKFITTFKTCFSPSEMAEISEAWTDSIHLTTQGDWLAHIMKTLVIAHEGNMVPYILINARSNYDGIILYTDTGITHPRGYYAPLSLADLTTDIENFRFHDSEVSRIHALFSLHVPIDTISSMRKLRALCIPGSDLPGTLVINSAKRIIANMSFAQDPLTGVPADWDLIFSLLGDPTREIPDDLFLHHSAFFETDRVALILSAFGETVPTFHLGTKRVRVSVATSSEADKVNAALPPYTVSPPSILQTKRVSLDTAVSNWSSLMRNGFVTLETERRVHGGRVYAGEEKMSLWAHLNSLCALTVTRSLEQKLSAGRGQVTGKRGRMDDVGETSDDRVLKKKKKGLRFS